MAGCSVILLSLQQQSRCRKKVQLRVLEILQTL